MKKFKKLVPSLYVVMMAFMGFMISWNIYDYTRYQARIKYVQKMAYEHKIDYTPKYGDRISMLNANLIITKGDQ